MHTGRRVLRPYYIIGLAVTTLLLLVVWVRFDSGPSPDHEASQSFLSHARKGELDARDSKDFASSSAGPWAASQEPPRGGNVEPAKEECPPKESAALGKMVPVYMTWHRLRHVQWQKDEVVDPILEAIAKEEEGQEGTIKGRGPVFRLIMRMLEAADSAQAALVQSGISATVALETLRAGAAGRTRDVASLAQQFGPYLNCLRRHRQAMEYLTELNRMPYFPNPIVDPEGELGPFIGAYMRKHIIVDHHVIAQGILIAALHAYKELTPSAKRSMARVASLALIAKALDKLEPAIAAEVRQGGGEKALNDFLDGSAALKARQAKASKDYEDAYRMLSKEYQEALMALAPSPPPEYAPGRGTLGALRSRELRGAVDGIGSTPRPRLDGQPAKNEGASTEKRIALVIGNNKYQEAPLQNPINDARAMEQVLREVGFEVTERENLTKRAMEEEIRVFGKQLRVGGVGLFYFAGHAVQVNGYNYLLPIGNNIKKEQDVEFEAVEARRVIGEMEAAENRLNIVILDACRNNPLAQRFRSPTYGLAFMKAPSGTVIAYATGPDSVANDGDGPNGLYTQELLQYIREPGLKLEDVFKRVRVAVKEKSRGKQLPWETSSLEGDFYFVKP
jgi:Caspase domain